MWKAGKQERSPEIGSQRAWSSGQGFTEMIIRTALVGLAPNSVNSVSELCVLCDKIRFWLGLWESAFDNGLALATRGGVRGGLIFCPL